MKSFVLEGPGGIPGLKQLGSNGTVTTSSSWVFTGSVNFAGGLSFDAATITAQSANAFSVGVNGTTNPAFNVDTSGASDATGLNINSAAAASGLALSVISSGTNENLTIDAKGSGTITLNGTATGAIIAQQRLVVNATTNNSLAVGPNGSINPVLVIDSSVASSVAGFIITGAATGGTVSISAIDSGSNTSVKISAKGTGTMSFNGSVTATAGGASNDGITFGSLNVGLFTGTGAPTFSAMNGSIYVDSNATTTTTRIYVNKSGAGTAGTTWTNLTTAA